MTYSTDFEMAWKEYPTTPNMSKKDAFKAWRKVERNLPPIDMLCYAIRAYKTFLAVPGSPQVKHMQGWISGERWEGWLEEAQQDGVKISKGSIPWHQWREKYIEEGKDVSFMDRQEYWVVPTQLPEKAA